MVCLQFNCQVGKALESSIVIESDAKIDAKERKSLKGLKMSKKPLKLLKFPIEPSAYDVFNPQKSQQKLLIQILMKLFWVHD